MPVAAAAAALLREAMKLQQDLSAEAKGLNSVRLLYRMEEDANLPPIGIRMAPELDSPKRGR